MIDFIIRVSFAEAHALGWDPTITLCSPQDTKRLQYDIVVQDQDTRVERTFRTKRLISNIGAEVLRSRGTRVWEVVELTASGREKSGGTYVLRDAWVDVKRAREGQILRQIRDDARSRDASADSAKKKKTKRIQWLKEIDRYLLTPIIFGDVRVNDNPDVTRNWSLPVKPELVRVTSEQPPVHRVTSNLAPVGGASLDLTQPSVPTQLTTKVHHRTVFKEVGKTIREVRSLREAYKYLFHAVGGARHAMCNLA